MAEETETPVETVESTETTETPVTAETAAPLPDPLAVATEARIRAEERARVLEEELARARAKPAETPPPPKSYTAEDVEAAFQAGKITDVQRIGYVADLQVQARLREQAERDRVAAAESRLQGKYNGYLARYPNLLVAGDPKVNEIWADVARLAEEEGLDPQDKRTQLRAMERVLGPLPGGLPVANAHETQRRRIPTGTGYGTQAAPARTEAKSGEKGKALFERLTSEAQGFYRAMHGGDLTRIYTTLEFADEGALRAKGRLAR